MQWIIRKRAPVLVPGQQQALRDNATYTASSSQQSIYNPRISQPLHATVMQRNVLRL